MFPFARTLVIVLIPPALLLASAIADAQTATATLSANLGGLAKLSLSTTSVSFPDANPDVFPAVPAASGAVTITAKARATSGSTITLTVVANDDLRSGVNTIPVTALTWTASGPGFVPGTMSRSAPQLVGSWTGSGVRTGTQNYLFQNSWSYASGTYSMSLLYTLSSP